MNFDYDFKKKNLHETFIGDRLSEFLNRPSKNNEMSEAFLR